jgi:glucose-6-phosphate-specific signal transduction histidine kinase
MTEDQKKVLYWAPRGPGLLFALFLCLFALDVFGEGLGFWRTLLALLMHLVPVFVYLLFLALAWRWEWIGAVFLTVLGCLQIWLMHSRHMPWQSSAFIAGPLFVIAALFLVNWLKRKELHAGR